MIGYEKQIKKMIRETNPGLERRFSTDDAFYFEDFGDAELAKVVVKEATNAGVRAPRNLVKQVVKVLARQRQRPNFGATPHPARARPSRVDRDCM